MIKYWLIRLVVFLINLFGKKIYFNSHEKFELFYGMPYDQLILSGLIRAYKKVFSENPWYENWQEDEIFLKIKEELKGEKSFLVIIRGNEEWPVAGFAWGAIISLNEVEIRAEKALGQLPSGLLEIIKKEKKGDKILYFDEFAIISSFRKGLEPIRFLLKPALEFGVKEKVFQTIFWSTPESKVVPLARFMGYKTIFECLPEKKKNKIIFLYNPNFQPLLKIAQKINSKDVARFMRIASKIL